MIMLILTAQQAEAIEAMNKQGSPLRRLEPIELPDGRCALNADLLTDLDPDETWWQYRTALLDFPAETVTAFKEAGI
jgi:hypothetical protein